ncbi:NAD(P)-binding protein [Corynespora cassiicola Philippines]|uniref:NAD(P)-binding protein n=1 Tax=Corynespora cassiicola Philippines TaxID=1448308 RepID=A0A2T2N5R3_CORCC|nr:NAD(P)-binding protein [Corynespora cassiicola Philippines]
MLDHLTKTVHKSVYPAIDPSRPALSAAGKTIIISGGASGIGLLTAEAFSAAGAARVVILARRQQALDEAFAKLNSENVSAGRSTEIWTYLLDITDKVATEDVFDNIRHRLNENEPNKEAFDADVLVTSAAYFVLGHSTLEYDINEYTKSFGTNVGGNLNLVRAFLAPEIPSIPFNKVILDVSAAAAYMTIPGQSPYAASKLAYTHIMRSLQSELDAIKGKPIRIHYFHPGVVYTPGVAKSLNKDGVTFEFDDESLPGAFAVWLASSEAEFLRGRFVMSAWDVDELKAMKLRYESDPKFGTITLVY